VKIVNNPISEFLRANTKVYMQNNSLQQLFNRDSLISTWRNSWSRRRLKKDMVNAVKTVKT